MYYFSAQTKLRDIKVARSCGQVTSDKSRFKKIVVSDLFYSPKNTFCLPRHYKQSKEFENENVLTKRSL